MDGIRDAHEPIERAVHEEISQGTSPRLPLRRWLDARRNWVNHHPQLRLPYLIAVAFFGLGTVLVGLILVPLPGPGWLIVFLGLSILGTEFRWAKTLTVWAQRHLERVLVWWAQRRARRARRADAANSPEDDRPVSESNAENASP